MMASIDCVCNVNKVVRVYIGVGIPAPRLPTDNLVLMRISACVLGVVFSEVFGDDCDVSHVDFSVAVYVGVRVPQRV